MVGWLKTNIGIIMIVTIYVVLGASYSVANPIFESPDEHFHFGFARHVAREQQLPIQSEATGISESHHPPLYYLIGALVSSTIDTDDFPEFQERNPFWGEDIGLVGGGNKNQFMHTERENPPYRGTVLAVHLLRLMSVSFGAITIILSYLTVRHVFPSNRGIAHGSAALVAFNPQFIFINSSVTNDSLLATLCTAVLFEMTRRRGPEHGVLRPGAILGVLVGAAILTKLTAVLLILLVCIALTLSILQGRSLRRALEFGVAFLIAVAVLTGWWFVRNLLLYGEISGMETAEQIWRTGRTTPLSLGELAVSMPLLWRTFWGTFGWGNVPLDEHLYWALLVMVGLAGAGLALRLLRLVARGQLVGHRDPTPTSWYLAAPVPQIVLLTSWLLVLCLVLARHIQTATLSEFGRYVFPAFLPIALLVSLGLSYLAPAKRSGLVAGVTGVGMLALAVTALFAYLIPAYARPATLSFEQIRSLPDRAPIAFGDRAEIVAHELRSQSVQPGETLEIDLYWRAARKMNEDYAVFVHLFTMGENMLVAQRDTYPGGGLFPTSAWVPGEVFRDTYRVKIPPSFVGPAIVRADVGLFSLDSKERLPLAAGDPGLGKNTATLGRLRIGSNLISPRQEAGIVFQDGIVLAGHELEMISKNPEGERTLNVGLSWRPAEAVQGDYTAFVHIVDSNGRLVSQHDSKPANGNYPTPDWRADEVITDNHSLRLPADLPRGNYEIRLGLYDLNTLKRLAVVSSSKPVHDSSVAVDVVSLK